MAAYSDIKTLIDDSVFDNTDELITGAIMNSVLNELVDEVGEHQVYVNPAVTDNPGSPQNKRAYIALPGTYTNFGGLAVTAPLGIIKWDGSAWSVTQLGLPSPHNYSQCKTTAALSSGTPYTSVAISMMNGGVSAPAGTWVQLVNRRTGAFDFVQITEDLEDDATTLTFKSRVLQANIPAESIVEVHPQIGMRWYPRRPVPTSPNAYFDLPSTWRLPPAECVDPLVYQEYVRIVINKIEMVWNPDLDQDDHYDLDPTNRNRVLVKNNFVSNEQVLVWVWQPINLTISA